MNQRLARYFVVAPTVLLSWMMGNMGVPLAIRLVTSITLGAALILIVARYQRRRVS